eukprot:1188490-Prorocentrum_minimum.AAC.3
MSWWRNSDLRSLQWCEAVRQDTTETLTREQRVHAIHSKRRHLDKLARVCMSDGHELMAVTAVPSKSVARTWGRRSWGCRCS